MKPWRASSAIQSLCARWNSTPSSSSKRSGEISRCPRTSRSLLGPLGGAVSATSSEFVRKTSRPPGRSRRAASEIHASGSHHSDAPYSLITRSAQSSGSGTSSALAWISGNSSPCSACIARAVASWFSVMSTPVGRAPRRASQAEK